METPLPEQLDNFRSTGFFVARGLLADDIDWISAEFDAVFRREGVAPDQRKRALIVPFLDRSERLCALLDNPTITEALAGLLGADYQYLGGDGNYFAGDTAWHRDTDFGIGFVKILIYLDPLDRDHGCLRVLPGTHRPGELMQDWDSAIRAGEVPDGVALETQPGDVVFFDHNLFHASFGGNVRRALAMNFCGPCESPAEKEHLRRYIASFRRYWTSPMHNDALRRGAPPERLRHLSAYPIFSRKDAMRLLMRRLERK